MPRWLVRVTRDPDEETCDFEVEAETWEEAKEKALTEARRQPEAFDAPPPPTYCIAGLDDDPTAAIIEDEVSDE